VFNSECEGKVLFTLEMDGKPLYLILVYIYNSLKMGFEEALKRKGQIQGQVIKCGKALNTYNIIPHRKASLINFLQYQVGNS
jgi:hypothetical protein